ncbi:MAG TPA: hypothetical protein VI731_06195, partial [Bacteroidia bacterium]|nr:hypothetical protein [Bacteroidia bacterium]
LPDFFWNWGEESAENIQKWMNRAELHKPVIGGNLWLSKWKHGHVPSNGKDEEEFTQFLRGSEKVILFSLQPLEKNEMIPGYLTEAIRKSPPGWTWLLRRHPFQKISDEEILHLIGETKSKLEIRLSSTLPLYRILRHTHHHVTLWSSVCFEAAEFDVPTTIAHPFGAALYDSQIRNLIFSYANTADAILNLVLEGRPSRKSGYIVTDPVLAERAFEMIGLPLS